MWLLTSSLEQFLTGTFECSSQLERPFERNFKWFPPHWYIAWIDPNAASDVLFLSRDRWILVDPIPDQLQNVTHAVRRAASNALMPDAQSLS